MFGGGGGYQAPKLSAISIQAIGHGAPIQLLFGTDRVSPILIWTANFLRHEHDQSGGKGVGGGGGQSYTYTADVLFAVTEGEVRGFGRVWRDKNRHDDLAKAGFSWWAPGARPQTAWGHLTTNYSGQALAYSGLALLGASNYALSDGATLGNHSVETFGLLTSADSNAQNHLDAHIKDIIATFLTDPYFGAVAGQTAQIPLDMAHMHTYCVARGLLISPLLNSTRPAHEYLTEWAKIANAGIVWSEGTLKFRPLSDISYSGAFGSYTPNTTISYHFDADDGAVYALIRPARKTSQDCYNQVTVEYINRNNDYNDASIIKDDLALIDDDGLRPADPLKLDCIKLTRVAVIVAYTALQQGLYLRNDYEIQTDCNADLLEPVDFVTVSCSALGLDHARCRVKSCEDNAGGALTFIVEEAPTGGYCG